MSRREPVKRKTDNRSLRHKVELRCWLLDAMHITDVRVLDTCAGAGVIWDAMRAHVSISRCIRSDIKPRRVGTLKLSAVDMIRAMPLDEFNVIDIDPYGEPWEAYLEVLARLRQPTAVFVTRGTVSWGVLTDAVLAHFGVPRHWPIAQSQRLAAYVDDLVLRDTWHYADIRHASVLDLEDVSYYALGLAPLAPAAPAAHPPADIARSHALPL